MIQQVLSLPPFFMMASAPDQNGMRIAALDKDNAEELAKTYQPPTVKSQVNFTIVPNPNNGVCKINYPNDQIIKLELFGIEGRFILEVPYKSSGEINFAAQPKGAYVLKLTNKKGEVLSTKLIKY